MKCKLRGGSLASNYVMGFGNTRCVKKGGSNKRSSKKRKTKKSRKSKTKKSRKSKNPKTKMRGGGSDWAHTQYSRGPINNPSTYNEQMFRIFNKQGKFYSTQGRLNQIGKGKKTNRQLTRFVEDGLQVAVKPLKCQNSQSK